MCPSLKHLGCQLSGQRETGHIFGKTGPEDKDAFAHWNALGVAGLISGGLLRIQGI